MSTRMNHDEMKQTILTYIKNSGNLTALESQVLWNLDNLADWIKELREDGHDIRAMLMYTTDAGERYVLYTYNGSDKH